MKFLVALLLGLNVESFNSKRDLVVSGVFLLGFVLTELNSLSYPLANYTKFRSSRGIRLLPLAGVFNATSFRLDSCTGTYLSEGIKFVLRDFLFDLEKNVLGLLRAFKSQIL